MPTIKRRSQRYFGQTNNVKLRCRRSAVTCNSQPAEQILPVRIKMAKELNTKRGRNRATQLCHAMAIHLVYGQHGGNRTMERL